MNFDIDIDEPEHGWLPIRLTLHNEVIRFHASDAINDPVQELVDGVSTVECGEPLQITWFFEPAVLELTAVPVGDSLQVNLHSAEDIESETRELFGQVMVERESFLAVLKRNIERFRSFGVEHPHWPEVIYRPES